MRKMGLTLFIHLRDDVENTVEIEKSADGSEILTINGICIFGIELIKEKLLEEMAK